MTSSNPPTRKIPFVDLRAQVEPIANQINAAMQGVVDKTAFILGPDVADFEQKFAAFCETKYALGVASGTAAIEMILRALEIGPGDEVITAANTFIATVLPISYVGAKPVLVDADPLTYNIDPAAIEAAITPRTRAIIPVHLYGQPADMDAILDIARRHDLLVIEDACQAHGARYKGKRAGSLGDAAAFGFYPAKNLGAWGDGGIVVTNNEKTADAIRKLRDYGQSRKYYHDQVGYNSRLDTLQAAVLNTKLPYLDGWNAARRQHAEQYEELLSGVGANIGLVLPQTASYAESVWHLYVIQVDDRDSMREKLGERGVSTGIHYPIPIHLQVAYQLLGYQRGDFPVTEKAAERILSLPMYAELTPDMIEYVTNTIKSLV